MGDEDLAVLARKDGVEYKAHLDPLTDVYEEHFRLLMRPTGPGMLGNGLKRTTMFENGCVPLLAPTMKIAVDPRRTRLEEPLAHETRREFLQNSFSVWTPKTSEFIQRTPPDTSDGSSASSLPSWLEGSSQAAPLVYAPAVEIDAAIGHFVPVYLQKKPLAEKYNNRMKQVVDGAYRDLLAFRRGERELRIPEKVRAHVQGTHLPGILFNYQYNVPLWYDDAVWPTIIWLSSFTHSPCHLNSIFADYDNRFPGEHIEQWITFDDVPFWARSKLDGYVSNYIALNCDASWFTRLPQEVQESSDWKKNRELLLHFGHTPPLPSGEYERVMTPLVESIIAKESRLHIGMGLLQHPAARPLLSSCMPDGYSQDLIDAALLVQTDRAQEMIKELLMRGGFAVPEIPENEREFEIEDYRQPFYSLERV